MDTALQSTSNKVSATSRILLNYELGTEDDLIDTTEGVGPLEFSLGQGRLHPAIEALLIGRCEGEAFECVLDASLCFGPVNDQLIFAMARVKLPAHIRNLEVGASFEGLGPDRKKHLFRVVEANDKRLTFDGNHQWAGCSLQLKAHVLKILN